MLLFGFSVIVVSWAICAYAAMAHRQDDTAGAGLGDGGVVAISGLGLLMTVLMAGVVVLRAGRLEKQIRDQQVKDAQNTSDLQRLSGRLVDALEEERRNVARELHDEIGQALTAIKMELSRAERARTPEATVGPLESARAATDGALHSVRDLSRMLHPRILDELGLVAALETQVRDFSRRTGTPTDLRHDVAESRVDSRVALCAYRIVQEALTNVSRHAAATRCRVSLARLPDGIRLTVEDDGRGFDPQRVGAAGGVGLLGIQERIAGCGGRYVLETGPGKGTRLSVDLPLRAAAEALGPDAVGAGAGAR